MKNIIVCSADSVYFTEHIEALLKSAQVNNISVSVELIDGDEKAFNLSRKLLDWAEKIKYDLEITYNELNIPKNDTSKILYSCGRIDAIIHRMEEDIKKSQFNNYFSLDIDSVVINNFRFPINLEHPISFYFRNPSEHRCF